MHKGARDDAHEGKLPPIHVLRPQVIPPKVQHRELEPHHHSRNYEPYTSYEECHFDPHGYRRPVEYVDELYSPRGGHDQEQHQGRRVDIKDLTKDDQLPTI